MFVTVHTFTQQRLLRKRIRNYVQTGIRTATMPTERISCVMRFAIRRRNEFSLVSPSVGRDRLSHRYLHFSSTPDITSGFIAEGYSVIVAQNTVAFQKVDCNITFRNSDMYVIMVWQKLCVIYVQDYTQYRCVNAQECYKLFLILLLRFLSKFSVHAK